MNRPIAVRVVLALALVVLSGYIALSSTPRLGLDLSGGTQIVLETRDAPSGTRAALPVIAGSAVTTLLAAGLLFFLASGRCVDSG
ncbi:MAG: hypothetical protein ACRDTA_07650 [Pseudonocardiaceae bacterium]